MMLFAPPLNSHQNALNKSHNPHVISENQLPSSSLSFSLFDEKNALNPTGIFCSIGALISITSESETGTVLQKTENYSLSFISSHPELFRGRILVSIKYKDAVVNAYSFHCRCTENTELFHYYLLGSKNLMNWFVIDERNMCNMLNQIEGSQHIFHEIHCEEKYQHYLLAFGSKNLSITYFEIFGDVFDFT